MRRDLWSLVSPGVGSLAVVAFAIGVKAFETMPPVLLMANLALGLAGYEATSRMTLAMSPAFIKSRLFGIDLNKPSTKRDAEGTLVRPYEGTLVPEAMGVIAGTVYLVCMFVFMPLPFVHDYHSWGSSEGGSWGSAAQSIVSSRASGTAYHFPHAHLSKFLCAFLSICCMCFLGFADNVLDLRWRDKLWLPLSASLPLMIVYAVDGGGTLIVLPKLLTPWLGQTLTLGPLYYIFMTSLAIFCTNSINILAGVNGLEVGQSVVIAATVILNNAIQLYRWPEGPLHDNNLFSFYLMVPFFFTSLALLRHNWYPSKIFVGDTYCYFAGMTFAVAAILGHNTKTVLLFFVPQILNFIYSVPQLFKFIPCPRHRMPGYLAESDQLCVSWTEFKRGDLSRAGLLTVKLCETFKLARFEYGAHGLVRMSNMTIICYVLHLFGPMHESRLTTVLLLFQVLCNTAALLVRYQLAGLLYDVVR